MPDINITETVDQIDQVSKTINDYGMTVTIIAVFIMVFILLFLFYVYGTQKQIKRINQDNTEQQNQQNAITQQLLNSLLEKKMNEETSHKDIVKTYIDSNIIFKDSCREASSQLKADRVAIYVFHNGNASSHGFPFFKLSCIGEYVLYGTGLSAKGQTHTDLPLHLFFDIIEPLYRTGYYYNNTLDNDLLNEFVSNGRVRLACLLSIKDDSGVVAGFSIAEFRDELEDIDVENTVIPEMAKLNAKIKPVILNSEIRKEINK